MELISGCLCICFSNPKNYMKYSFAVSSSWLNSGKALFCCGSATLNAMT
jgi:hypothetical protein